MLSILWLLAEEVAEEVLEAEAALVGLGLAQDSPLQLKPIR